jgi:hypothetical protein
MWCGATTKNVGAKNIQKETWTNQNDGIQRRVKIAPTLTVKGTMMKSSDFNSEVVN